MNPQRANQKAGSRSRSAANQRAATSNPQRATRRRRVAVRRVRNQFRRGSNGGELTTFAPLSQQSTMTNMPPLITSSSDGSVRITASTNGREYMAIDYDAADSAPTSSQQISSYWLSKDSAVWQQNEYVADVKDLQKFGIKRYMRYGALAANLDIKTYDVGTFYMAAEDCADTSNIGVLFVEYDVEFQTPQLDVSGIINSLSAKIVSSTGVDRTHAFGSAPVITGGLAVVETPSFQDRLSFNRTGQYLVEFESVGTVFTGAAPVTTGSTAAIASLSVITDAGALNQIWVATVNALAGQTLVVNFTTTATTLTSTTVRIAGYPTSLA